MFGDAQTTEATDFHSTSPHERSIHIVVDVPNIVGGMRQAVAPIDSASSSARDVRLDPDAFHELTVAGRRLGSAVWAGTSRPSTVAIFERARRLKPAIQVVTHEPGLSGCEVGVDAVLQAHL